LPYNFSSVLNGKQVYDFFFWLFAQLFFHIFLLDDPDGGVSCRCTGWKIGFGAAIFFAVFSLLGLAWAVRKFRQPIQDGVAPEIANVENAGDVIENRNVNRSQKCDSRGTPDDEDDVPMVLLS